jgi:hypothetical protein
MSLLAIRRALEAAVAAMTPVVQIAYENSLYTPTSGTAYQRLTLLPQRPGNEEIGPNYTQEGDLQIDLFYPADGSGPAAAQTRAELIRSTFKRGNPYSSGGVTVTVMLTPEIGAAYVEADRFVVPVFLRIFASITA